MINAGISSKLSGGSLVVSSLLLFIDQIIVSAIGGWFYWLMVSKLTSASDIGQATAVYSLVNLAAALSTLGLEYPLLKRSHAERSQILGTALIVELGVTLASMPLVLYVLDRIYTETFYVVVVATIILISWAVLIATRFAILGTSNSRVILLIDVLGTAVKFASAYVLIYFEYGSLGILTSIMLFNLSSAAIGLYMCTRFYGFTLSLAKNVLALIKEGLANMPSILSKTLVYTLTVVLLAAIGTDDAEVGTAYIVLMISLFAGSLVTSIAYMIIPFSSASGSDHSLRSTRLAVSFTVPIIAVLITSPSFLLSLIGQEYADGHLALIILSIGLIPFSVVTLAISKFNYLGEIRKLVLIGSLQVASFVLTFVIFTSGYGISGAAISVLVSYVVPFFACIVWSDRLVIRYTINSLIAITVAWVIGHAFLIYNPGAVGSIFAMALSAIVSLILVVALKNISIREMRSIIVSISNSATRIRKDER